MDWSVFRQFSFEGLPTPMHIIDEVALERNLEVLERVQRESGARVILALKAFAQFSVFPRIRKSLPGATASSLNEARLAREEFGGEVHICAPAYSPGEIDALLQLGDHIVFNSTSNWERHRETVRAYNAALAVQGKPPVQCGLRINPEHSEGTVPLYDPCAPGSRLGVRASDLTHWVTANGGPAEALRDISGLHFHTLCEQGLAPLRRTLAAVEERFEEYLPLLRWINFGGGHHITREDYDVAGLVSFIKDFRARYSNIEVYLEPGEAVVLGTGVLAARVLDLLPVGDDSPAVAILDTSATAHMPDTLEMPYRADILGAGVARAKAFTYRLGGLTCLAGDMIGEYSFDLELSVGDVLFFLDMSHYTMVKNTCFNGVGLPAIAIANSNSGELQVVKTFGYESYRNRLS